MLNLEVDVIKDRGIGVAIKCGEETVADVYLEFYEGNVKVIVTDEIIARNSDEASLILPLLESMTAAERELGTITVKP